MNIIQRTTLTFLQEDRLEILIQAFLETKKAENVTSGTLKFYRDKLLLFNKFCLSQEIKQASALDNIAPYLETLQQPHLVERIVPVTESQPHKIRWGVYRLKDNFLRFWFRFVLPNHSQLERGAKEIVFDTAISQELDAFTSTVFEQFCHQYFWRKGLKGKLPFLPKQIGGSWQANEEIDIALLSDTHTMLVECKWSRRPIGIHILEQLERKAKTLLREVDGQTALFGLCSRTGFTDQMKELAKQRKDVILYDWVNMVDE